MSTPSKWLEVKMAYNAPQTPNHSQRAQIDAAKKAGQAQQMAERVAREAKARAEAAEARRRSTQTGQKK